MTKYTGGCHCGAVRYEAETDLQKVIECNCSHCYKKGFLLTFVDKEKFELLSGRDNLQEYQFNKKAIRHLFCKLCGVQSFAEGIAFPQFAVNVRCLDGVEAKGFQVEAYNGKDI